MNRLCSPVDQIKNLAIVIRIMHAADNHELSEQSFHIATYMSHDRESLVQLLPFYVNGSLPSSERNWIDHELQRSPELRAEVSAIVSLQTQIKAATSTIDCERGWDQICKQILGDPQAGRRLRSLEKHSLRRWSVPVGLAASILASVLIAALMYAPPKEVANVTFTPLGESGASMDAARVVVQVTFRPTAQEGAIRELIAALRGEIVAGPGALGIYSIRLHHSHAQQAVIELRARAELVESVSFPKR